MNLNTVDLNLLLVFEALFEEQSVSRAAHRVGITQPAMSNALGRLRSLLDDALFVRKAGRMEPTPRAHDLAGPVREALAKIRSALEPAGRFNPATARRTLTVAATDYAEVRVIQPLLDRITRTAPGVEITLRRLPHVFQAPDAALTAGEYDLAISFFPDAKSLPAGLHGLDLFTERNVLLSASPEAPKTVAEFAARTHVATFYSTAASGLIDNLLMAYGVARQHVIRTPHFLTAPFLVAGSERVAVVPEGVGSLLQTALRLHINPVPLELPDFVMRAVWHARSNDDPAHRWLRNLLLNKS